MTCSLRQQAMESFKRKAMESSQTAADLKLHLEKYHSQLREAQTAVVDKTTAQDQQSFKYRRIAVSNTGCWFVQSFSLLCCCLHY